MYLIGRLATGVEVKEVNGGSKVSSFILAVDRNAEEADIFRIKAWNSQAEAAGTNDISHRNRAGCRLQPSAKQERAFRSCLHRLLPAKRING